MEISQVPESFLSDGLGGDLIQQIVEFDLLARLLHLSGHIVRKKIQEVLVDQVLADAVANVDIRISVIVHVKQESAPTPICSRYTGVMRNIQELPILIIQLQCVLEKL